MVGGVGIRGTGSSIPVQESTSSPWELAGGQRDGGKR